MKSLKFKVFLFLAIVLASVVPASADVIYSFTECSLAPCYGYSDTWSFEVPAIITQTTTIPGADLFDVSGTSWVNGQLFSKPLSVEIVYQYSSELLCYPYPYSPSCAYILEDFSIGKSAWGFTPIGPFDRFGTYNMFPGGPLLTITKVPDAPEPSPTPEPSPLILVSVGSCAFAVWQRMRQKKSFRAFL